MGAYENPPIIRVPNYSEIFMKNFMPLYQMGVKKEETKKAQQADSAAAYQKKKEDALEKTIAYKKDLVKVTEGSGSENLVNFVQYKTDAFYKNEDALAKGKISFDEYSSNRMSLLSDVDKLGVQINAVTKFQDSLKDKNISNYQENQKSVGLLAAVNSGSYGVYNDEDRKSTNIAIKVGDNEDYIDEKELSDPNFYAGINEVADMTDVIESTSKLLANQVNTEFTSTTKTDQGETTSTVKTWKPELRTEEQRLEYVLKSKTVGGLSSKELGSYLMDNLYETIDVANDEEFQNHLNNYNLSEEQKNNLTSVVKQGGFDRSDISTSEGETLNNGNILLEYARKKIAQDILEKADAQADISKSTETVQDLTTEKDKKDKDTKLNEDIAQRLLSYDLARQKFDQSTPKKDFVSKMFKIAKVNADPIYAKDNKGNIILSEIIGYKIQNPNLPKEFGREIYMDESISDIDSKIKAAIGATKSGAAEAYNRLTNNNPPKKGVELP